ncbi:MAG TPA: hypothetical protein VK389_08965, partial [Thermoanaerobaculia bacterium]|nr:hypothetical protein [Thermoanaerobaculia bacterium]
AHPNDALRFCRRDPGISPRSGLRARPAAAASNTLSGMNDIAPEYVKLVLALGTHDKDYVDAFYGPAEWRTNAEAAKKPLGAIAAEADALIGRLQALPEPADEMLRLRLSCLTHQLRALAARVASSRSRPIRRTCAPGASSSGRGSGLHLPHRGSGLHLPHWKVESQANFSPSGFSTGRRCRRK